MVLITSSCSYYTMQSLLIHDIPVSVVTLWKCATSREGHYWDVWVVYSKGANPRGKNY